MQSPGLNNYDSNIDEGHSLSRGRGFPSFNENGTFLCNVVQMQCGVFNNELLSK